MDTSVLTAEPPHNTAPPPNATRRLGTRRAPYLLATYWAAAAPASPTAHGSPNTT